MLRYQPVTNSSCRDVSPSGKKALLIFSPKGVDHKAQGALRTL